VCKQIIVPLSLALATRASGTFQKAEIEKWWPIIKAANIKVE
jgi:hypothetical protein